MLMLWYACRLQKVNFWKYKIFVLQGCNFCNISETKHPWDSIPNYFSKKFYSKSLLPIHTSTNIYIKFLLICYIGVAVLKWMAENLLKLSFFARFASYLFVRTFPHIFRCSLWKPLFIDQIRPIELLNSFGVLWKYYWNCRSLLTLTL